MNSENCRVLCTYGTNPYQLARHTQSHCTNDFSTEEEMLDVHSGLSRIRHPSIAQSIHISYDETKRRKFLLCLNVGRGRSLLALAIQKHELFFRHERVSDFFVSIIRSLVEGLHQLKKVNIFAIVEPDYIRISETAISEYGECGMEDTNVWDLCVFTKYSGIVEGEDSEWRRLAKMLRKLNEVFMGDDDTYEYHDPAMNSFLDILYESKKDRIDQILQHPLFWDWRKRRAFICHASDLLSDLVNRINKKEATWSDSFLAYSGVSRVFEDSDNSFDPFDPNEVEPYWVSKVNQHSELSKYKENADLYALTKKGENFDNHSNHLPRFDPRIYRETCARRCIVFMRTIYSHFELMKYDPIDKNINIRSPYELEGIFRDLFPDVIFTLAEPIADYLKQEGLLDPNCDWPDKF